jgi:hypothetical protein
MPKKPRKKPAKRPASGALGSSRKVHIKSARTAYKYAMSGFAKTIQLAQGGDCDKAFDNLTVALQDQGTFIHEFRHATGYHPQGVMDAPRAKQKLTNAMADARQVFGAKCMRG